MAKMFVTEYERYERWSPAEGGCILTGTKDVKTYEVENKEQALAFLLSQFYSACEWFGEGIKFEKMVTTEKEWGFIKSYSDGVVHIQLVYDKVNPICSDYEEQEDGYVSEEYSSYLLIDDNELDYHGEFYPETEACIHARPAIYC